jgi:hypothetical protein
MISDQQDIVVLMAGVCITWFEFLDSKLASLAMSTDCFVHSSIGSATDETDHFVSIYDSDFALISRVSTDAPITWIWAQVSKFSFKYRD